MAIQAGCAFHKGMALLAHRHVRIQHIIINTRRFPIQTRRQCRLHTSTIKHAATYPNTASSDARPEPNTTIIINDAINTNTYSNPLLATNTPWSKCTKYAAANTNNANAPATAVVNNPTINIEPPTSCDTPATQAHICA